MRPRIAVPLLTTLLATGCALTPGPDQGTIDVSESQLTTHVDQLRARAGDKDASHSFESWMANRTMQMPDGRSMTLHDYVLQRFQAIDKKPELTYDERHAEIEAVVGDVLAMPVDSGAPLGQFLDEADIAKRQEAPQDTKTVEALTLGTIVDHRTTYKYFYNSGVDIEIFLVWHGSGQVQTKQITDGVMKPWRAKELSIQVHPCWDPDAIGYDTPPTKHAYDTDEADVGWTTSGYFGIQADGSVDPGPEFVMDKYNFGGAIRTYKWVGCHDGGTGDIFPLPIGFIPRSRAVEGKPVVTSLPEVFARGKDHQLWHATQTDRQWSAWSPLGGNIAGDPVLGGNAVYARQLDGTIGYIYRIVQPDHSLIWSGWQSLGGAARGNPVMGHSIFYRGTDAQLHRWTGSRWESLGGSLSSDPAFSPDGKQVFARFTDGAIWHMSKIDDTHWGSWLPFGGRSTGNIVVLSTPDLEVLTRGPDNSLWHRELRHPDGSSDTYWTNWSSIGGVMTSDLALAGGSRPELFALGADGRVQHIWRSAKKFGWSAWESLGGPVMQDTPAIGWNQDKRMELFAYGSNGSMYNECELREAPWWPNLPDAPCVPHCAGCGVPDGCGNICGCGPLQRCCGDTCINSSQVCLPQ